MCPDMGGGNRIKSNYRNGRVVRWLNARENEDQQRNNNNSPQHDDSKVENIFLAIFVGVIRDELRRQIFKVAESDFEKLAMEIFQYQFAENDVYRRYCELIGRTRERVKKMVEIPFLPVEFFRTHQIKTSRFNPREIFSSSGTTGSAPSRHYVMDPGLYEESFQRAFEIFFGRSDEYAMLALLPSYLERDDSSLIFMVEGLMEKGNHPANGFFLSDHAALHERLKSLEEQHQKSLLIGVSFALIDFTERYPIQLKHTQVMETGGMKGRREEITREALHQILKRSFGVDSICSEYGMTELLSQAYSLGEGKFKTPPWMKVLLRDINDPGEVRLVEDVGKNSNLSCTGGVNIIDFANLDSCSFLATQDLMKIDQDGTFEILGRMDYSDVRGCNLMWE